MQYNFDTNHPIYLQFIEKIKLEIISGRLKSGDKLPSVREFALSVGVNPNTVQKALQSLEREGLIYTERTNGKYVTNDKVLIEKVKNEVISHLVEDFLNKMSNTGIDKKEIIKYLKESDF